MELIIEEFFSDTKNIYFNGMSLGFIKMSLALSQSKLDLLSLKFLLQTNFLINWSGAVAPEIGYIGKIFKPLFILSQPIITNIHVANEFKNFRLNIDNFLQDPKNIEQVIQLSDQKLIQKLKTTINDDKLLARMLLIPPFLFVYNTEDMIIDGQVSIDNIFKDGGLLDILYADFPEKIKKRYKAISLKYSSLANKDTYKSNNRDLADYINHNPDTAQLLNIFELQFTKNKYIMLEEVLKFDV
jgi:hypothetical protein